MRLPLDRCARLAAAAALAAALLVPLGAFAAQDYHGRRAWRLQNDRMQVTIVPGGGHIASMTLNAGRGAGLNPLWQTPWRSLETGQWRGRGDEYGAPAEAALLSTILGHNLCLDFFGAPSESEAAAGMPVHGEAPAVDWTAGEQSSGRLTYSAALPMARMRVTRSVALAPHSSAIWITETIENQAGMDRAIGWQQHPTLGPPFLEDGASFFDMPAGRSMVFPTAFSEGMRLRQGAEFQWPRAPRKSGGTADLREWPAGEKYSSDYTAQLIDTGVEWAWFTALNNKRGLLIGYLWPRKEWPWVGNWEENRFRQGKPWLGKAVTRGMEFGTTPFPESRRDAISRGRLFDTPTYRWIAAKEKQTIGYGAFLASIPEGTTGVREVRLDGNQVRIRLRGVEESITLPIR